MDVQIRPDGKERFIVSCPNQMEWRARVDLVKALKDVTLGVPFKGLIVDLDGVTYINSAGLGAIFALRKFARDSGAEVVVSRPSVSVTRLLETINLQKLMPITATIDEARTKLS